MAETAKLSALKAYWEKCSDSYQKMPQELTFQQRKTINRKTHSKPVTQPDSNHTTFMRGQDRPKTGIDVLVNNSDRIKSVSFMKNEKDSKDNARYEVDGGQRSVRRNCVSVFDDRTFRHNKDFRSSDHGDLGEWGKFGELDFTEKIKAFRALIKANPNSTRDRHSNGEVKAVGSHVKFLAKSRDIQERYGEESELKEKFDMYNSRPKSDDRPGPSARPFSETRLCSSEKFVSNDDIPISPDRTYLLSEPGSNLSDFTAEVRALNFSFHTSDRLRGNSLLHLEPVHQTSKGSSNIVRDRLADVEENLNKNSTRIDTKASDLTTEKNIGQHLKSGAYSSAHKRVIKRNFKETSSDSKFGSKGREHGITNNEMSKGIQQRIDTIQGDEQKLKDYRLVEGIETIGGYSAPIEIRYQEKSHNDSNVVLVSVTPRSSSTIPSSSDNRLNHWAVMERSKSATPVSMKTFDGQHRGGIGGPDPPSLAQLKSHIGVLGASLECLSNIVSDGPDTESNPAHSESASFTGRGRNATGKTQWVTNERTLFVLVDKGNKSWQLRPDSQTATASGSDRCSLSGSEALSRYSGSSSWLRKQTNVQGFESLDGDKVESDRESGLRFREDVKSTEDYLSNHRHSPSNLNLRSYSEQLDHRDIKVTSDSDHSDIKLASDSEHSDLKLTSDSRRRQELRKMVKYIYKRGSSLKRNVSPKEIQNDIHKHVGDMHEEEKCMDSTTRDKVQPFSTDIQSLSSKRERPKIISRNVPLQSKSPHATRGPVIEKSQEESPLNNAKDNLRTQVKKHEIVKSIKSGEERSEPKIIKRNNQPTRVVQSERSQSEIFFKNTLKETMRQSPLPSKSNVLKVLTKSRPQSAVEGSRSSSVKKVDISKPQSANDVKTSLKEKLEKLRVEIDHRLSSKENLKHYVRNFKLKDLDAVMNTSSGEHSPDEMRPVDSNGEESDSSDYDYSETRDSDTSLGVASTSTINHFSSRNDVKAEAIEKRKHFSNIRSGDFLTSTPVKTTTKDGSFKSINQDQDIRSIAFTSGYNAGKKPSNVFRREKDNGRQLTPNTRLTTHHSNIQNSVWGGRDKTRMANDDINLLRSKEAKILNVDADMTDQPSVPNRPGSVGSREKYPSGQHEIVSRILNKMATRNEASSDINKTNVNGPTSQSSDVSTHGRASPAERLLTHLDNPRLVKLLQMLYQADTVTRQIIMIKVQYFTAWHEFTVASREQRKRKQNFMKQSLNYNVVRLLSSHFNYWSQRAIFSIKTRKADAIFRRHMLAKGFKALHWSVRQSLHLQQKLQAKNHFNLLKGSFLKWEQKAVMQRNERIENSFRQWKQFVQETLKVRYMQEVSQRNTLIEVLRCWKKLFSKHQKLNKAGKYFRMTLLKHSVAGWKEFVFSHKAKKEKYKLAVMQYESTIQSQMFCVMVSTYRTSLKIKAHFRYHLMRNVFKSWKAVSEIFKVERNADIEASIDHWITKRTLQAFFHWHEQLKLKRAEKMDNFRLCKKLFTLWLTTWKDNMAFRSHIDQIMLHKKLHMALLRWRQNVVILKRRQRNAVALIENCHMRKTFNSWRNWTAAKRTLRKKVTLHQKKSEDKTLQSCFVKWKESYLSRMEAETAKRIFAEACARKMAAHWKLLCHKRSLNRMLACSQPQRDKRLLRVYFSSWLSSLEKLCKENIKADEHIKLLKSNRCKNIFMYWLQETRKLLKIKPLVLQRRRNDMAELFSSWWSLVQHKSVCKKNLTIFQQRILLHFFNSWKRQYRISQTAKDIEHRLSQGLLRVILDDWRFFIVRKKNSEMLRERLIMKHVFYRWKNKATTLFTQRTTLQEELEANMELKKMMFNLWKENVLYQKLWMHKTMLHFIEKQNNSSLVRYFLLWRKLLHSSLISKAYHKTFNVRLLGTYFSAWQQLAGHSITDAVFAFSERIGLVDNRDISRYKENYDTGDFNQEESNLLSWENTSTDTSESFIDCEIDRTKLLNVAIEAAKEDRQAKCLTLKETVTKAIIRIRHWPLCIAFEQWKEYSQRRVQLKTASAQLKSIHIKTTTLLAFHGWKMSYNQSITAHNFWKIHLLQRYFVAVRIFKEYRKYITHLSKTAHHHRMLKSFQKYFPVWQLKAQDKQQKNYILHLWNSLTPREMELHQLEKSAARKINHRTLLICFSRWFIYYKALFKIRQVYSQNLLKWVMTSWKDWALGRHQLSLKSHAFLYQRQTKMAFLKWCKRLEQKRKTEQMYQEAWNRYLSLILHEWSWWANTNHRLRILRLGFEKEKSQKRLIAHFDIWKSVTVKVKSFRCNSKQKLLYRMFREWRLVVKDIQSKKQEVLQFQIHCYTLLVRRLFYRWGDTFQYRKKCSEERQLLIQHKALNFASIWRKKAQKTRGLSLKTLLEKRKLLRYFQHWASSLSHIQMLYVQLDKCLKHKHALLTRVSLRTWKIQLLAYQAKKMHTCRIMYTMLTEWKSWTRTSRERRIRGLALKKALQERNLHVYFQYWVAMTKVKLSVQQGLEIKLQIRVFRAWCAYTRQTNRLRELRAHMAHKVNMRIIQNTFMIMRWRAEYCTSLNEMADKVIHDREVATMRAVLVMWKDRLNSIEAVRCYQHILTVRVVKRWHKFVTNKYLEHQKEEDNWNKAVRFYNKFLCKSVLTSLKQEVTVHKLIERRRQRICENCAKMWKSRVDLTFTAIEMEREFYLRQFWSKWRTEYVKCSCTKNICNQYSRYSLKQIFKSWQKLCLKPSVVIPQNMPATTTVNLVEPRSSLLPIPVSQTKLTGGQKTPHKTVHNVS